MLKNKLLAVSLLLGATVSFAQLTLNSPYSRFGIGNTFQRTNAFYESMGGLSNSYASSRFINTSNPALLNATSVTTFDLGVEFQAMQVSQNQLSATSGNFSFDYLDLAFPIHRNYTFALGLRPYSSVNYTVNTSESLDASTFANDTYNGSGGISSVSFTNSYSIINDSINNRTLALGLDAAFLVGSIQKNNSSILNIDGVNDISYTSSVNSAAYRGFNLNFGTSIRKEFFVGDAFQTIKNSSCDSTKQGQVTLVPKLFYADEIEAQAKSAFQTKYAIIFVNSSDVKISSEIKNGELREQLLNYYNAFVKKGFGVLVLDSAKGISYSDLKNDYLDFIAVYRKTPKESTPFEGGLDYSKDYLRYGSGIFFNAGASFETAANMKVSGTEEITRVRTSTGDAFQSYQLSQFSGNSSILPSVLRLGISIDKPNVQGKSLCGDSKKSIWVVGADFSLQNWSIYRNVGLNPNYSNTMRIALGGSITPNPEKTEMRFKSGLRELFNVVSYQSGVYYQSLPFKYNDKSLTELGINFGLTIPVNHDGSMITWNFGLATRGSDLKENYFKLGLGLTLNERNWFRPVKVGR